MNDDTAVTGNGTHPNRINLANSIAAFIVCFLVGAMVGCVVIYSVISICYGLLLVTGLSINRSSSSVASLFQLLISSGVFATSLVLLSRHLRRVGRHSIINIRCAFLSGATLLFGMAAIFCLFMLFASCGIGQSEVRLNLDLAKRSHLAVEGNTRGFFFEQIALNLDSETWSGKRYSEAQIIEHLGVPDLVKVEKNVKTFAYFYDRLAKRDWVVYVDFDLRDPYATFGYNDASVINHSNWKHYEAN